MIRKKEPDSRTRVLRCINAALEKKAKDLIILNVREISAFADYFIICSGRSSRQVQGLADHLEESLKEVGIRPLGIEGRREGHWILMDYGDVIIHIFYEPTRHVYELESLWSEAKPVDLTREGIADWAPNGRLA